MVHIGVKEELQAQASLTDHINRSYSDAQQPQHLLWARHLGNKHLHSSGKTCAEGDILITQTINMPEKKSTFEIKYE